MGTTAEKKEKNRVEKCEQVNSDIKLGETSKVVHNKSEFQFHGHLTKRKKSGRRFSSHSVSWNLSKDFIQHEVGCDTFCLRFKIDD